MLNFLLILTQLTEAAKAKFNRNRGNNDFLLNFVFVLTAKAASDQVLMRMRGSQTAQPDREFNRKSLDCKFLLNLDLISRKEAAQLNYGFNRKIIYFRFLLNSDLISPKETAHIPGQCIAKPRFQRLAMHNCPDF